MVSSRRERWPLQVAYLIDRDAVGGGMAYIRRKQAERPGDTCRVFTADRGECTASNVNAWGADLIHVNHLKALVQLFANPFVSPRGKLVFTVHGIHLRQFDFLPKTFGNRAKRALRRALEGWLYRKCDALIALTETDAADIRRLYGPDVPVSVEPNTIDVMSLRPDTALAFGAETFAFVCIARFDFQKGQDVLVEAIALAQATLRAAGRRTLFVGDGRTCRAVKRRAETAGVGDLVVFAGEIPDAGVYMTCGQILVAPSRWEGMPYLLLEAVARNRRVLASDCPGNRDVLAGYPRATLFPVEDAQALARHMERFST